LRSATHYFFGAADAPVAPPFMANAMGWSGAQTPWMGSRFGPGRDPWLEYRG
jgi:hypothetical protein